MKASFGGKEPYYNEFEVQEDFSMDPFAEEYQPISSIHGERFTGRHFYFQPAKKQERFSEKQQKNRQNQK